MIRVRVKGSPDRIEGFIVWGHALYAPYGADIVCAGVTAVCMTTLIGIARLAPGHVVHGVSGRGILYCRLTGAVPGRLRRDLQLLLEVMVCGLQAIQSVYGAYVDLVLPGG